MSAIRKAARGEECTLNIAGVCSYDHETVVLCHFPSDSHGVENTGHLLLGYTLYKAKPVEKERERGE